MGCTNFKEELLRYDNLEKNSGNLERQVTARKREYIDSITGYSKFKSREIGDTLAYLMTAYEKDNFVYSFIRETINTPYGSIPTDVEYTAIMRESLDTNLTEEQIIHKKNKKELIILIDLITNQITFLNSSCQYDTDFGNYDYIEDFMDYLINYRIQNNLLEINREQLYKIVNQYMREHQEEINSYKSTTRKRRKHAR